MYEDFLPEALERGSFVPAPEPLVLSMYVIPKYKMTR